MSREGEVLSIDERGEGCDGFAEFAAVDLPSVKGARLKAVAEVSDWLELIVLGGGFARLACWKFGFSGGGVVENGLELFGDLGVFVDEVLSLVRVGFEVVELGVGGVLLEGSGGEVDVAVGGADELGDMGTAPGVLIRFGAAEAAVASCRDIYPLSFPVGHVG